MIRTYLLTFLLLICLPTVELLAQYASSVSGMVTDERELPLSGVAVYNTTTGKTTFTDAAGYYYVPMRAGLQTELQFRLIGYVSQKHTLRPREGEDRELNVSMTSESKSLPTATITAKRTAVNIVSIPTQAIETIAATNAGVEAVLKTMPGVVSNNELSSQYSVRGGNFDENLVYVNDFEIYRPFLIRSGQQEGSSFINPDMVSSVSFSAGGFEAKYGDRMASVLDVKYRRPREWRGTLGASFLGFSGHLEGSISNRTTISVGIRQKSNQYLLNALPTKGEYAPTFTDMQGFVTHQLHPKWQIQAIGNFASNRLTFLPVESSVAFGTFNDNFKIITAYEGSENDSYQNGMAGVGLIYTPQNDLTLKLLSSGYRSREIEAYNILGFYYIGEIEKDLTKDDFGDVTTILGVGTSHDWARNRLDATIANVEHRGNWSSDKHFVSWGLKAQRERFDDQLNEWTRVDSADFTLPVQTNSLLLKDVLRAKTTLETGRYMAFVQDEWTFGKDKNWSVIGGLRTNYYELNQELLVTPRFQIGWRPELCRDSSKRAACTRDLTLRAAVGLYHQPPLYRELRQTDGVINPDLLAQKSLQMVLGGDYNFRMWGGRPFKLTTEVYYKHLWDLVSYSFDNLLIRYSGQNDSKGYATGIDMRLFGQFIKDT
ncbi:MAG TPA: carboxypeptidase-like regulatory domain-containing protein, partial [Chitinophagales bacterium]|nr:carboxypeptidase-like regulatory domain-containing protein [Chitinophagales bacterium]